MPALEKLCWQKNPSFTPKELLHPAADYPSVAGSADALVGI